MNSCGQVLENADPITLHTQKFAETKIVPRRPKNPFKGSETQHPKKAEPMYGAALIRPTRKVSLVELDPI
jgi:hypothetical protein